ncbi:hypothetical protein GLOIN_2v1505081 [Rhizophagus irregularis DAOM 181602=DAOM 197198]|uniref:Transmembrane protein n=1 Tax=Rhizophagus irregularis (strain DAOM 181602 / DAOM 197198 / MUCL 43194) TaxID=747089 RepID=A0A2P4QVS5_RHIID|nr:hypothetical protein GLOIN_2v1505081 [Rhizophagus irregularis DAOM 181602=DAOM 197198]POG81763.1 hypothetical protein GLOIN_2v1505081 [Rhizophagus irregularis DAOM 181602=DAOM 197198]|eukprot:XP_025188629.1 hypothetical protein GLOIN_2v1505081 [Rhizophagus irregularis DAOM 181602=DAOM 197198]
MKNTLLFIIKKINQLSVGIYMKQIKQIGKSVIQLMRSIIWTKYVFLMIKILFIYVIINLE